MLYIKEITDKTELYNTKYSKILNTILYFIKFTFCILTLKNETQCYIPYKKLKNSYIIKIIVKMLAKQNRQLVLSKSLQGNCKFIQELNKQNVHYLTGKPIFEYTILDIVEYIGKVQNKEIQTMEISLLINKVTELNLQLIQYLAQRVKRINIITKNITKLKKIEETLQEKFGITILVTNNKKKSLAKASLIINLDFKQEELKLYNINRKAIIVSKTLVEMNIKSFNGIFVKDYSIKLQEKAIEDEFYKNFENKVILESILNISKSYEEVSKQLKKMQVKVTKLWGKNGEIRLEELKNIKK